MQPLKYGQRMFNNMEKSSHHNANIKNRENSRFYIRMVWFYKLKEKRNKAGRKMSLSHLRWPGCFTRTGILTSIFNFGSWILDPCIFDLNIKYIKEGEKKLLLKHFLYPSKHNRILVHRFVDFNESMYLQHRSNRIFKRQCFCNFSSPQITDVMKN